jgi:NADPH:quinone reductase
VRAIQVNQFGGPEVLQVRELPDPEPAEGLVTIDVSAAGINYADTHQADNTYLAEAKLPLIPGGEVVGTTPEGTRVVALLAGGGYAQRALAAPELMFPVPDDIEDGQALAIVLQGATAWHLLGTCAHLQQGESVLVHAAAGGVGSVAIQLAKRWGAGHVVAAASSEEKRQLALDLGADAVIDSRSNNLKQSIEEANAGKVDIVLEMVGGSTFDASLAAVAPFGRLVVFGMASREPPTPVVPAALMRRSRAVIGFWLMHCLGQPDAMLRRPIEELFGMISAGGIRAIVGDTYPLSEARKAHEDMRARRTVGKLVLDPNA